MTKPIRVLIVDDSAFARKVVRDALGGAEGIEVVGHARDGLEAIEMAGALRPDVMTLDIHMPELDGVGVLEALRGPDGPKIVVVSTVGGDDELALRALELGAIDIVQKPTSLATVALYEIRAEVVKKVRAAAAAQPPRRPVDALLAPPVEPLPIPAEPRRATRTKVVVLGTSTGGPQALGRIIPQLPADFPVPMAVVVHIPRGFTAGLADRLQRASKLRVCEAEEGRVLAPGEVAIAPTGHHLQLRRGATGQVVCHLAVESGRSLHCPSVDQLFTSAARSFGAEALGVVLTGMGEDGTEGARAIREARGRVLVEDESSCVVYGMPRAVFDAGLSTARVPLEVMIDTILGEL